jgi:hypothetical protein
MTTHRLAVPAIVIIKFLPSRVNRLLRHQVLSIRILPISGTVKTSAKEQMMRDPTHSDREAGHAAPGDRQAMLRPMPFLLALPFNVLEAIGWAGFYTTWHLLYFIACAFRALTAFMFVAAVGARRLHRSEHRTDDLVVRPFVGTWPVRFAVGYNLFLDWFAPPGAEDPFDRYRPSAKRRS